MAAEEELDAEVELESSRVRFGGAPRTVVSVPIGVDYDRIQGFAADPALPQEQQRLRELLGLRAEIIGLGVDRLDYTKGIPERLDALDALLTQRPELRGTLTFVQIGVPSRSDLDSYAAIEARDRPADRRTQRAARACRAARRWSATTRRRSARSASSRSTVSRTSASSARCTTG